MPKLPQSRNEPSEKNSQVKSNTSKYEKRYLEGFPNVEKPETTTDKPPTMPTAISSVSLDVLGDYMSRYSAWREFAEEQLIRHLPTLLDAQEEYDYKYNKLFVGTSASTVTDKKAIVAADENLRGTYRSYMEADVYKQMLSSRIESYTQCINTLSREITRRGQIFDRST